MNSRLSPQALSDLKISVSVCICTYHRPRLLKNLLIHLMNQVDASQYYMDVIVVDNDKDKSAKIIVEEIKDMLPFNIHYYCEPVQNISLARNRAVLSATGDLIAFIDDDEYPAPDWLKNFIIFFKKNPCDGVLGPVRPVFEIHPPKWIIKSKLFDRPERPSGAIMQSEDMRTGNSLIKRKLFLEDKNPFDPKFGLMGGEDVDFFQRMVNRGYKFLWCQEAIVFEIIPKERLNLDYHIKRGLSRGNSRSMMTPPVSFKSLISMAAIGVYFIILPFSIIMGFGLFNKYLIKFCDHLGKFLGYLKINPIKMRPYKSEIMKER